MKAKYETPTAEKLEFNYSETVVASSKSHASKGPAACGTPHVAPVAPVGPIGPIGPAGKTHASGGPAKCN